MVHLLSVAIVAGGVSLVSIIHLTYGKSIGFFKTTLPGCRLTGVAQGG
jgi:hypothetical protein